MSFSVSPLNKLSRHSSILVCLQALLWNCCDICYCLPNFPLKYLSQQSLKCRNNHFLSFIVHIFLDNVLFAVQLLISGRLSRQMYNCRDNVELLNVFRVVLRLS